MFVNKIMQKYYLIKKNYRYSDKFYDLMGLFKKEENVLNNAFGLFPIYVIYL